MGHACLEIFSIVIQIERFGLYKKNIYIYIKYNNNVLIENITMKVIFNYVNKMMMMMMNINK